MQRQAKASVLSHIKYLNTYDDDTLQQGHEVEFLIGKLPEDAQRRRSSSSTGDGTCAQRITLLPWHSKALCNGLFRSRLSEVLEFSHSRIQATVVARSSDNRHGVHWMVEQAGEVPRVQPDEDESRLVSNWYCC